MNSRIRSADYTVRNSGVSASKNHSFQISEKTPGTGNQNTTEYSHWQTLTIEDLLRDGYASVFVGTGVWKARNLGIPGECLSNVHFGIDYLANPSAYSLGEKVAVIGMGNAAMDVARTALRNGAHQVTMYARGQTDSSQFP